jgi:hypothetical protein
MFVGSTPGDVAIKDMLNIRDAEVDFIRWELVLVSTDNALHNFSLKLNYGISKPNALGFMDNGKTQSTQGLADISNSKTGATVYILKSPDFNSNLSLIKLNSNVLHILTRDERLMIGNGGWSYSLNKKNPTKESRGVMPPVLSSLDLSSENTITFAGRTPCEPVNTEYNLNLGENCLKVKWLLKLYIEPVTHKPTSFYWNRTGHRSGNIEGTWSIETSTINNLPVMICRLKPVSPFEPIDMLIADGNVMYFLDKSQSIMTGDENFSFALNRILK